MVPAKVDAIARGDSSGAVVHPIFVHLTHLVGCIFHRDEGHDAIPAIAASCFRIILNILSVKPSTLTPLEQVRSYCTLTAYFLVTQQSSNASKCLQNAHDIIARHNLHIDITGIDGQQSALEDGGHTPANRYTHLHAIDAADEEKTLLCHVVWLDLIGEAMFSSPLHESSYLHDEFRVLAVGCSVLIRRRVIHNADSYLIVSPALPWCDTYADVSEVI